MKPDIDLVTSIIENNVRLFSAVASAQPAGYSVFKDRIKVRSVYGVSLSQPFHLINPLVNEDGFFTNYTSFFLAQRRLMKGIIRVYLVNPILKSLLDLHGIDNYWNTGLYTSVSFDHGANEDQQKIEFAICKEGKTIGYIYDYIAKATTEQTEICNNELTSVDQIISIDWSGTSEDELERFHKHGGEYFEKHPEISLREFFTEYLDIQEYDLFIEKTRTAINTHIQFLSLQAIPQLKKNYLFSLKEQILAEFSKKQMQKRYYCFKETCKENRNLSPDDTAIIEAQLYDCGYINAVVGEEDFAKCFLTSEYLYRIMDSELSIDYTAIIVGYLKSVELLLNKIFINSQGGNELQLKWGPIQGKKTKKLYASLNTFVNENGIEDNQEFVWNKRTFRGRLNKNTGLLVYQEKCLRNIKSGSDSLMIGDLITEINKNKEIWMISNEGRNLISSYLEDYRKSCRNELLHKECLLSYDYTSVERIRNNTLLCLCYLLGAIHYNENGKSIQNELGIIDYSLEKLFKSFGLDRKVLFKIETVEGYKGYAVSISDDHVYSFDSSGKLNCDLLFVKIEECLPDMITQDIRTELKKQVIENMKDPKKLIHVTRQNMLLSYEFIDILELY